MEWKTLIILYGDTCCNSRSHPHKNQYNYTTDILHFYFWQSGTGSSLFLKPTTDAKVLGFLGASFSSFGVFVFEFWVLRFRSRVLRFRDLGASCFGLRFRVLRFETTQSNLITCQAKHLTLFLFLLNLFVYLFVISKELVDSADSFPDVLSRFEQWLRRQELGTKYKFGVVTDG